MGEASTRPVKAAFTPGEAAIARFTGLARGDVAALTVIVLAAFAVHAALMIDGFGEPDAARLANDAILWHNDSAYVDTRDMDYRARILPVWLLFSRLVLDLGIAPAALPAFYNAANVLSGSLVLVPLFLIWRRLFGREIAYWGLLVASLMPAFWVANIYGYPHLPAFTFCVFALHAFLVAFDRDGSPHVGLLLVSIALLGLGLGIKADLVLMCGAFLGVPWSLRRFSAGTAVTGLIVVGLGALVPVLLFAAMTTAPEGAVEFAASYNRQYPVTASGVFSINNALVNFLTAGPVCTVVIAIAVGCFLRRREDRHIAIFLLSWSLPVILFWDIRGGNSARHLMSALVPLAVAIPLLGQRLIGDPARRGFAVAAILIANYVIVPPLAHTVVPSTRLIASRQLLQSQIDRLHADAGRLAEMDERKIFLIGSWTNPYVVFAMLAKASVIEYGRELRIMRSGGAITTVAAAYVGDAATAMEMARKKSAQGYRVVSLQYDFRDLGSTAKTRGTIE